MCLKYEYILEAVTTVRACIKETGSSPLLSANSGDMKGVMDRTDEV